MKVDFPLNSSLSNRLAEIIKEKIFNGELKPGAKVRVKDFAKEFQTSTTPVRDALNRLVSEGIMTLNPRVGYYVKSFSPKEVDDIFFVRTTLEVAILESIFDEITEEDLIVWRQLDERYANKDLSEEEMYEFSHEGSIHLQLCNKCTNQYLKDVYVSFFERVLLISSLVAHEYDHYTDHSDILDAIETGNLSVAKKAMELHLEGARASVHNQIKMNKGKH